MITNITRTVTLIAAMLTIGQSFSAEPIRLKNTSSMEQSLHRALNKHLSFPLMEKGDMTGEVLVSFAIDKEGKVQVLECNSANERLKNYVIRKLARIDIGNNPDGVWRITHMRISFKPERT